MFCNITSFILFVSALFGTNSFKEMISVMAVSALFAIAGAINHHADQKDQTK